MLYAGGVLRLLLFVPGYIYLALLLLASWAVIVCFCEHPLLCFGVFADVRAVVLGGLLDMQQLWPCKLARWEEATCSQTSLTAPLYCIFCQRPQVPEAATSTAPCPSPQKL